MQLRKLGRSDLNVSELCLGTMQFGWTADEATSFAVMDAFVAAGGNFIDTADIYTTWGPDGIKGGGRSEKEIVSRWMKARGNRNRKSSSRRRCAGEWPRARVARVSPASA